MNIENRKVKIVVVWMWLNVISLIVTFVFLGLTLWNLIDNQYRFENKQSFIIQKIQDIESRMQPPADGER